MASGVASTRSSVLFFLAGCFLVFVLRFTPTKDIPAGPLLKSQGNTTTLVPDLEPVPTTYQVHSPNAADTPGTPKDKPVVAPTVTPQPVAPAPKQRVTSSPAPNSPWKAPTVPTVGPLRTRACRDYLLPRLGDADVVAELCKHTDDGFTDLVCNTSLTRRKHEAWMTVHECDFMGEGVCTTVRNLIRRGYDNTGIKQWAAENGLLVNHGMGKRQLTKAIITRIRDPPNATRLFAPFSDPQTCDVRAWLGTCPVPRNLTQLMVVARGSFGRPKKEVDWLDEFPSVPHVVYSRGQVPPGRTDHVYMPGNFGYEASSYIKFLLDCWDQLPDYTAFLHAHLRSWHNTDIVRILKRLRWGKYPYVSLNMLVSSFTPGVRPKFFHGPFTSSSPDWVFVKSAWPEYFFPTVGALGEGLPGRHFCAQHVTSRESLRRLPKKFWTKVFGWLMRDTMASYHSARCLENTWSFLLTGQRNVPVIELCDMCTCDGSPGQG
uniref:Protein xylosyltransferase n=1 Tax=Eutreptiella gymnastica TaxID=73025 RepID=A0A7S1IE23_9EUGL|mmetsp:Transcript_150660/g.263305  ORF Transcript_150660/g.263305 Transcript_150660/m.263305 type:complete len:488 (+) Transcript_150660:58-1521(+)